jgi:glycogen debranching enzyme
MDKMGSSEKAGNKGYPATSRDGAPIEMTALLKLALDFVIKQHHLKLYDYDGIYNNFQVLGVKRNNSANRLTFKQWNDYII